MFELDSGVETMYSIAGLVVLAAGITLSSDTRAVFDSFARALQSHDVEAAMSHLAEDFVIRDQHASYSGDREAVRAMVGWDVAVDGSTEFNDILVKGDAIHVRAVETNRFIRLLGVNKGEFRLTFVIRDGLIREEIISGSTEFMRSVNIALQPVIEWATDRHPKELAKVYVDEQLIYTEETARLWIALLEKWKTETASQ